MSANDLKVDLVLAVLRSGGSIRLSEIDSHELGMLIQLLRKRNDPNVDVVLDDLRVNISPELAFELEASELTFCALDDCGHEHDDHDGDSRCMVRDCPCTSFVPITKDWLREVHVQLDHRGAPVLRQTPDQPRRADRRGT